jgi:hypothetical protein
MKLRAMDEVREANHAAARDAWAESGRTSPVDGLAERIRASKNPRPVNPERRKAERALAKHRQQQTVRDATHPAPKAEPGRYFPHQSDRERNRRLAALRRAREA